MKTSKRQIWIVALALGIVVLLTLFAAPNNPLRSGSTFNRAPDGYGAWYTFMEQRGTKIQRWQRPFQDLLNHSPSDSQAPSTLVRINSHLAAPELDPQGQDWVRKGNTLVSLGIWSPVTPASFHTLQSTPVGKVKVDTRRRLVQHTEDSASRLLLGDRFGAVVWQENLGKGRAIFATTPHLAANAYQDYPGNYEFLAQLVTQNSSLVWVDEYIHGYKAADVLQQEASGSWVAYLAKTPLLQVLCQSGILLLILIWAKNRRLGPPLTPAAPMAENSQAYIQALADVLYKAESNEFVLDIVGKAEQRQVQTSLGLGPKLLEHSVLIDAWVEQTNRPAVELERVLRLQSAKRRISEPDLLTWLENIETVRRHLPSFNP